MAEVKIKKNGSPSFPWQATCTRHKQERLYFGDRGAASFNSRGVGNRSWAMAMFAALCHINESHYGDSLSDDT